MARPMRTMIRKQPLGMEELTRMVDVEQRPLDVNEVKQKAYPKV